MEDWNSTLNTSALRVVVGSQNPVKVNAVKAALAPYYPAVEMECVGMPAPSGVPDQPMNEADTRLGAVNRVEYCMSQTKADFYVAMEGGVDLLVDGPCTFAYVVIANAERRSVGRSAMLPIPKQVFSALRQGEELGHVMDRLFNTVNVKQKGGAIGLLTHGRETRESAYSQALALAMAPFLHPDLYSS